MSVVDAAALPVWTYDPDMGQILDETGRVIAGMPVVLPQSTANAIGPLLAAAPLVPALVAALRNVNAIGLSHLEHGLAGCPACALTTHIRELLAHPALIRLGEHT